MDSASFADSLSAGAYLCDIVLCLKSELFLLSPIAAPEWTSFAYCEWCNVSTAPKE